MMPRDNLRQSNLRIFKTFGKKFNKASRFITYLKYSLLNPIHWDNVALEISDWANLLFPYQERQLNPSSARRE